MGMWNAHCIKQTKTNEQIETTFTEQWPGNIYVLDYNEQKKNVQIINLIKI